MNELSPSSLRGLSLGSRSSARRSEPRSPSCPARQRLTDWPRPISRLVIVDPPRKGLDPELTQHWSSHPPEGLIYVSCGLESLLRDAAQLTSHGKLRLVSLTAFNLMPFTEHVETVARFERIKSK